jgi:hypothetical protein
MPFWPQRSRGGPRAPALQHLTEKWRATVPGHADNLVLSDATSASVFVSDGWGVPYAALTLRRYDLATGRPLAARRTRSQGITALLVRGGTLFAATGSRLFELSKNDLSILRQWEKGLVADARGLISLDGSRLVMGNWLRPSIGIFDPAGGTTKRVTVGVQPLLFAFGHDVRVIAGFSGGMWTVHQGSGRLTNFEPTPPVSAVASGRDLWAALAGAPQGGQGQPPVWFRRGTEVIATLTERPRRCTLGGPCDSLFADAGREVIWCLTDDRTCLEAISEPTGASLVRFGLDLQNGGSRFCHVDPEAGVAFALEPHLIADRGRLQASTSVLACYSLPE